jgi:aspartyl protease family protein
MIPHTGIPATPFSPPLLAVLAALVVIVLVTRRRPLIRTLVSLALWAGLAVVLVVTFQQRSDFSPYLARIAAMLKLDGQEVVGKEVRIRMSPDGHFWARVNIDGVERRMLIDSGATVTALSTETANAAGLKPEDGLMPVAIRTANGMISAQTATATELRLGDIRARGLTVVVSPAFGDSDILGMNFLSRLKSWRVEDGTMILVPHHPKPSSAA